MRKNKDVKDLKQELIEKLDIGETYYIDNDIIHSTYIPFLKVDLDLTFIKELKSVEEARSYLNDITESDRVINKFESFDNSHDYILYLFNTLKENYTVHNNKVCADRRSFGDVNEDSLKAFLKIVSKELKQKIKTSKVKIYKKDFEHLAMTSFVLPYKIKMVHELDNTRFVVSGKGREVSTGYYWSTNKTTQIDNNLFIYPHNDSSYNYMDVGRILIYRNISWSDKTNKNSNPLNYIFTDITSPTIPKKEIIEEYFSDSLLEEDPILVDDAYVKLKEKKYAQKLIDEQNSDKIKQALKSKILLKIKELESGNSIQINNVKFEKDKITYQNQDLKLTDVKELKNTNLKDNWVKKILEVISSAYSFADINFDNAFETFIRMMSDYKIEWAKGEIGDVNFEVKYKEIKNKNNVVQTLLYINDNRIKHDELSQCLERALCYNNQKSYNSFLDSVSSCSLHIHRYLHTGVWVNVTDTFNNERIKLNLTIKREKNLNYLIHDNKKFKLKNTNRFINLEKAEDITTFLNTLLNPKVVENFEEKYVKDLIESGKEEAIKEVEREQKLIEDTEKAFNLKKIQNKRLDNGVQVGQGYLIPGKLRQYLIDLNGNHKVYSFPDGFYICMVDKTTSLIGIDKLIGRIYALSNDNLVASKISTLGV